LHWQGRPSPQIESQPAVLQFIPPATALYAPRAAAAAINKQNITLFFMAYFLF
jgi:hypothetical protein